MNGGTTEPEARSINPPSRSSHKMIVKSENFFCLHKRPQIHKEMIYDVPPTKPGPKRGDDVCTNQEKN
jgi:hypothetical protein